MNITFHLRHGVMAVLFGFLVFFCIYSLNWSWLPNYWPLLLAGLWRTIWLLVLSCLLGFVLAVMLGWAQYAGPWYLARPARVFCLIIRGTPLLIQIWLIYYGLGSLFPQIAWIKQSDLWPILRQAWPYALCALTFSFAGYEGEVMRSAFASVPKGQLEAARAMGMPRFTIFRRVHFPLALHSVLPTLAGETILQMKATPLVSTITFVEIYAVVRRILQDTFIIYEPLLMLALVYLALAGVILLLFKMLAPPTARYSGK